MLLLRPRARRRGVANELLAAATKHAFEHGATGVEAYPHERGDHMGTVSMFEHAGFEELRTASRAARHAAREDRGLPARPRINVMGARFGQVWTIRGAAASASFAVVSDDGWNDEFPTLFVIELEHVTRPRARAGRSVVDKRSGTVALVDRLATVHESMLAEHIGGLTKDQMQCIAEAMGEIPLDYCIRGGARPVVAAA